MSNQTIRMSNQEDHACCKTAIDNRVYKSTFHIFVNMCLIHSCLCVCVLHVTKTSVCFGKTARVTTGSSPSHTHAHTRAHMYTCDCNRKTGWINNLYSENNKIALKRNTYEYRLTHTHILKRHTDTLCSLLKVTLGTRQQNSIANENYIFNKCTTASLHKSSTRRKRRKRRRRRRRIIIIRRARDRERAVAVSSV